MAILDTHEFITGLQKTGFKEEQAKIIADGINSIEKSDGLAKSSDVAELKGMMKVMMAINIGTALGVFGIFLNGLG